MSGFVRKWDLAPFECPPGNQALFAADIYVCCHSPEYKSDGDNISSINGVELWASLPKTAPSPSVPGPLTPFSGTEGEGANGARSHFLTNPDIAHTK